MSRGGDGGCCLTLRSVQHALKCRNSRLELRLPPRRRIPSLACKSDRHHLSAATTKITASRNDLKSSPLKNWLHTFARPPSNGEVGVQFRCIRPEEVADTLLQLCRRRHRSVPLARQRLSIVVPAATLNTMLNDLTCSDALPFSLFLSNFEIIPSAEALSFRTACCVLGVPEDKGLCLRDDAASSSTSAAKSGWQSMSHPCLLLL